jgi:hypothetical protein
MRDRDETVSASLRSLDRRIIPAASGVWAKAIPDTSVTNTAHNNVLFFMLAAPQVKWIDYYQRNPLFFP